MKLSTETLKVLQNFATINPNIVVEEKTKLLKTVSEAKNIMAIAEISEDISASFGIYDLNEFLSATRLIDKPTFTFGDQMIEVKSESGTEGLDYFCSNPEILTHPKKDIKDPTYEVCVVLSDAQITQIKKAASVLGCETVSLTHEAGDSKIWAVVSDPTNKSSNAYRLEIADGRDYVDIPVFSFDYMISNLKIVSGDYTVSLSSRRISKWALINAGSITYWIALENSSSYDA